MTVGHDTAARRVLVRARGLAAFRAALVDRALAGSPIDRRRRAILLPTRAAGEVFRQTLEHASSSRGQRSLILPHLVTRADLVAVLHGALGSERRLLTPVEREVMAGRAMRDAMANHPTASPLFDVRPGLVAALLAFYDELRRRQRGTRRFVRTMFRDLAVERGSDRGSESLIQQTRLFGFTFLAYERALAASGGMDEHVLRERLLAEQPELPFDHLVIAVADHPADPRGLWPADFDLLGRLRRLSTLDVVVTDEAHDAGFRARLEEQLPGVVEARAPDAPRAPVLIRPPSPLQVPTPPVFVFRDREEEVRAVARTVRAEADLQGGRLDEAVALVFQRPLPYLYLAQHVLTDAGVPYQAFDALPLAAEPYAALLDQVMAVARRGGTRESVVALLRAPVMEFSVDGHRIEPGDAAALDALLADRRAAGDARTYPSAQRVRGARRAPRRPVAMRSSPSGTAPPRPPKSGSWPRSSVTTNGWWRPTRRGRIATRALAARCWRCSTTSRARAPGTTTGRAAPTNSPRLSIT
jgi:hypothetical protein